MNVTTRLLSILTAAVPLTGLAQAPLAPTPVPPLQPVLPAPAEPAPEGVVKTGEGIMLNFQGASLSDVLNYLSEAAGFVIVQEAPVSGTVNIVSRQPISPEECVDLLNSVLFEKGYTAIRNNRILKIVSRSNAPRRDLPVEMGADPEQIPRKDEMVTQILPLRFGEAAKLIENLRPLLAESATISANEASNAILLTDTQTNIRRIAQIIRALDTSVASISSIHIFPLQFADAKGVANVLTQLFSSNSSSSTANAASRDRGRRGFGGFGGFGGFPGGGGQPQTAAQSEAKQAASRVVAVADEQSNSLVVSAPEEMISTIKDIVMQIDTSITDITDTQIFRLLHADAVELADIINNLYTDQNSNAGQRRSDGGGRWGDRGGNRGGSTNPQQSERALLQSRVVAVGDPRTNSLVVTAAQGTMTQIAEMIGRLDATDAKKQRVVVHSLQHADVENVAAVLRGMLGQQTGTGVGTAQTGVSRLTERTATGAQMDADQVLSGSGGRSSR